MAIYRSPYEAYPFLCDADDDLRCDFELLTDELASGAGLLRSQITQPPLADELLWVCELIYHMNPYQNRKECHSYTFSKASCTKSLEKAIN